MNIFLIFICSLLGLIISLAAFPDGATGLLILVFLSAVACYFIGRFTDDGEFLIRIFLGALVVRVFLTTLIYLYDLYDFFGPDARWYDTAAQKLTEMWAGQGSFNAADGRSLASTSGAGWGMLYLTASLYYLFGRSMLIVQMFLAFFGAATVPMVYFCTKQIYSNQRVARTVAVLVAFFPAMIIWSSQMLKDGLILFFLVAAMTMVLQLQKRLTIAAIAVLVISLFGLLSLRFYTFYMAAAAAAGSFVVGTSSTMQSLIRRSVVVLIVGVALAYLGVLRSASSDIATYGSLQRVEVSRSYASDVAGSGFGEGDVKLNSVSGVVTILPVGMTYLMLAPFPWQATNFRQALTIPEAFLWWSMIPLGFFGLWYTLKNRFRSAIPILFFTFMLTIAYSLYQGNVGTAYRQRTQIQVFLFMFIAVGWTLWMEKREDSKLKARQRRSLQMTGRGPVVSSNLN